MTTGANESNVHAITPERKDIRTMTATYDLDAARNDHPLWFERDAMRFFGTRLGKTFHAGTAVYLVTSEQPPHGPRTYNVRRFDPDTCDTIGPPIHEGWGSRARAQTVAAKLADAERAQTIRPRQGAYHPCDYCDEPHQGWAGYVVNGHDVCSKHLADAVRP